MADLTTLAAVTAWLRFTPNAADSALLASLISNASAFVETWCGRPFLSQLFAETYDGNGREVLFLNNAPVTAVASVNAGTLAIPPSPGTGMAGFGFDNRRLILLGYRFPRGIANVAVSYTAGYAEVPLDVQQAVIDLIALRYREIDRIGMASQAVGGETTAYTIKDMPPQVATILGAWRRAAPQA